MPYIKKKDRKKFDVLEFELHISEIDTPGELNYLLTRLCQTYFGQNGESYQTHNDILGALEGCKLEYYRRVVEKYENSKIKENGDVY